MSALVSVMLHAQLSIKQKLLFHVCTAEKWKLFKRQYTYYTLELGVFYGIKIPREGEDPNY